MDFLNTSSDNESDDDNTNLGGEGNKKHSNKSRTGYKTSTNRDKTKLEDSKQQRLYATSKVLTEENDISKMSALLYPFVRRKE